MTIHFDAPNAREEAVVKINRAAGSAVLFLLIAGCAGEGPKGAAGTIGPQGPAGPSGTRIVWTDAAGTALPQLIGGIAGDTGVFHVDATTGYVWKVEPNTGTVDAATVYSGNLFFTTVNCSGTGHIPAPALGGIPPLPRVTFRTAMTGAPPFDTDVFVIADDGGITSITHQSTLSGSGSCGSAVNGPVDMAAITSLGPAAPVLTIAAPIHPELLP